ncbi:MAG: NfeD family protein [Sideroxydans sp.]|nr:NfeD family protein [Sideroxydans sp.]
MASYIYWFLLALALLMAEMATGTFYMLVLSLAVAVGGVAALLGLGEALQFALSGLAGVAGIVILRRLKSASPADAVNSNFDIGQPVQVVAWHEDGTLRVHYRGAEWDAELETTHTPHEGTLYIKATHGSKLVLTHRKPQQQ